MIEAALGRLRHASRRVLAPVLRRKGGMFLLIVITWLLIGAVTFSRVLGPIGGPIYAGDVVTPPTSVEMGQYLVAFSGPWDPQPLGGTLDLWFTNPLAVASIEAVLAPIAGSPGEGIVLLLVLTEAALGVAFWLSARRFGASSVPALIGALAFAASPWVFDRFVAGHESILLAYALVPPFLVLLTEVYGRRISAFHALATGLVWGAIGLLEYHLFYLVSLAWAATLAALVIVTLVPKGATRRDERLRSLLPRLGVALIAPAVAAGVNFLWIVPALAASTSGGGLGIGAATIANTLAFTQGQLSPWNVLSGNGYFSPAYSQTWTALAGAASPIIVSILLAVVLWGAWALAWVHRRPATTILALLALAFTLLSAGTLLWGSLYLTAAAEVPLFAINDDPNKFDSVALPALVLLLTSTLDRWWSSRVSSPAPPVSNAHPRSRRRAAEPWAAIFIVAVLMVSGLPFLTGDLGGHVARDAPQGGLTAVAESLETRLASGTRLALFPPDPSVPVASNASSTTNPLVVYPAGGTLFIPRTTGVEIENAATESTIWAYESIYANVTDHAGSLLGLLGASVWAVNLSIQPSNDHRFSWDSPSRLEASLSAQTDLGPAQALGGEELYQPDDASPNPIATPSGLTVAVADRQILLDAAYVPGGGAWLEDAPFVLTPQSPLADLPPSYDSGPLILTPAGFQESLFASLPSNQVVDVAPAAWSALGTHLFLPDTSSWVPWEVDPEAENGSALSLTSDWASSDGDNVPLTVGMDSPSPGSNLWVQLFYGPQEGNLTIRSSSGGSASVDAWAAVPEGFEWTELEGLAPGSSITLAHEGAGESLVAQVAAVTPAELATASNDLNDALAQRALPQGEETSVLWVKPGVGLSTGGTTWSQTGSIDADGYAVALPTGGTYSTYLDSPAEGPYGVVIRMAGTGSVEVSLCPASTVVGQPTAPCNASSPFAFLGANTPTPIWIDSPTAVNASAGPMELTLRGSSGALDVDQLLLVSDLGARAGESPLEVLQAATSFPAPGLPVEVVGDPSGDSTEIDFGPSGTIAPILLDQVPFESGWVATTGDYSLHPLVVEGWATAFVLPTRVGSVIVELAYLVNATTEGAILTEVAAALIVVIPLAVLFRERARQRKPSAPTQTRTNPPVDTGPPT